MNILRKQISEKTWTHMSTFTIRFDIIKPWRTRLRRDLNDHTEIDTVILDPPFSNPKNPAIALSCGVPQFEK